jgi:3-hydroxypropanoate dehydrogenase
MAVAPPAAVDCDRSGSASDRVADRAADRAMTGRPPLSARALDVLFRSARSHNGWLSRPVTDDQLRQLHERVQWGPTASNSLPARLLFVRTPEAKQRLEPCLAPGNVAKTMSAPVTAIIGYDTAFYEHLPRLFPHNPTMRDHFVGEANRSFATTAAFRNGTLQGAYLMLAARALGLDCGPMSGFDPTRLDQEFWAGTTVRTNFLCNLGYGDVSKLLARHPRLGFDESCQLL